jgi:hypothetical protein
METQDNTAPEGEVSLDQIMQMLMGHTPAPSKKVMLERIAEDVAAQAKHAAEMMATRVPDPKLAQTVLGPVRKLRDQGFDRVPAGPFDPMGYAAGTEITKAVAGIENDLGIPATVPTASLAAPLVIAAILGQVFARFAVDLATAEQKPEVFAGMDVAKLADMLASTVAANLMDAYHACTERGDSCYREPILSDLLLPKGTVRDIGRGIEAFQAEELLANAPAEGSA